MEHYEKLGSFYLGKHYDLEERKEQEELLLYDSKDLVTHAMCVGMTGSGKTGLCIGLLEEAALDGIPAIVIDPKGDLGNLLLTFPGLAAEDFRPWINEDDALRKDLSPDEFAAQQAALWKKGLGWYGQTGERIQRLKDSAEFTIYTPGSDAGWPISILSSFSAPSEAIRNEGDLLRDRVSTTATSLLGLLGIDADPIQSREHILLSTILGNFWAEGRSLDLSSLIGSIQSPPVKKVGVIELDSFFPSKDRFKFAMRVNNLLAAPSFQGWMEGQALDLQEILYTPTGKPRIAVFSIAHLSDPERMFFVSLLLNETLSWMRSRPGTTSLRAVLYMDEIFGYMPPVAEPPSKKPLLTLLKQARAYGVGVVLATQNPADLDYKGLSNIGTWFIGRLQTERDKERVLAGLEGIHSGGSSDHGHRDLRPRQAGFPASQRARGGSGALSHALGHVLSPRPAGSRPDQATHRRAENRSVRRTGGREPAAAAHSGALRSGRPRRPGFRRHFRDRAGPAAAPGAAGSLGSDPPAGAATVLCSGARSGPALRSQAARVMRGSLRPPEDKKRGPCRKARAFDRPGRETDRPRLGRGRGNRPR